MKRILLISYNFSPEPTGIGKYNGEMIKWMVDNGYDCSVITSYPYYPHWKVDEKYQSKRFTFSKETSFSEDSDGSLDVYRAPMYVPSNPSGLRRILLDFSFFITAFLVLLTLLPKKKFDSVIVVAPSFQNGLLGLFYKMIRGGKLLYHIQDMQVEAARDLKMIKSKILIKILFKVEYLIFKYADIITSISEEMIRRTEVKAFKRANLFPNWANTDQFFQMSEKESLKIKFGFRSSDKIILYSGAIGEKQGLEAILFAAEKYKTNANLKFVICGSGPYKPKLQETSEHLSLKNVVFFPIQPLEVFNDFLNMADVHLVIQKANASDLVMPSKLTSILAVGGLALITANKGSGLHTLVQKYNMGILVEAEDQLALHAGIEKILSENWDTVKSNARYYAEQFLSIENVMGKFQDLVFGEARRLKPEPKTITTEQIVDIEKSLI
jgi:colanic acid biosynthesis glycosyl transferase WcaI